MWRQLLLTLSLVLSLALPCRAELLFMDSFDHYATADLYQKWTSFDGTAPSIGAVGRNSTNGLQIGAAQRSLIDKTFATNANDCIVGAAFKASSFLRSNDQDIFAVFDGATPHVYLAYTNSGAIKVYRGDGTQLGSTVNGVLATGNFYYVELRVKVDNSTGTVAVKVNGTSIVSLSSQDTQNGGSAQWSKVRLARDLFDGTNFTNYYDDLYVADNSGSLNNAFLGPVRVKTILPDGAGNSTDFTPSTGSNFQNVDDTSQDGDSTYNSESTAGDHDTYTFGAIGLTGAVKAIQVNLIVRSAGAGAETVRPKIRISTTDYNGTTVGLSTSFTDLQEIFETSPATAVAFTVSEIDGAEFGMELVGP